MGASEGLAYELKSLEIDLLILNPRLTKTEMTANYDFLKSAFMILEKKPLLHPVIMNKMMRIISKK